MSDSSRVHIIEYFRDGWHSHIDDKLFDGRHGHIRGLSHDALFRLLTLSGPFEIQDLLVDLRQRILQRHTGAKRNSASKCLFRSTNSKNCSDLRLWLLPIERPRR